MLGSKDRKYHLAEHSSNFPVKFIGLEPREIGGSSVLLKPDEKGHEVAPLWNSLVHYSES